MGFISFNKVSGGLLNITDESIDHTTIDKEITVQDEVNDYNVNTMSTDIEKSSSDVDYVSNMVSNTASIMDNHDDTLTRIDNGESVDVGVESVKLCSDISLLAGAYDLDISNSALTKSYNQGLNSISTKDINGYRDGVLGLKDFLKKVKDKVVAFFKMIWDKIKQFWNWITGNKKSEEKTKERAKSLLESTGLKDRIIEYGERLKASGSVLDVNTDKKHINSVNTVIKLEADKDEIIKKFIQDSSSVKFTDGRLSYNDMSPYSQFELEKRAGFSNIVGKEISKLLIDLEKVAEKQFNAIEEFNLRKLELKPRTTNEKIIDSFTFPFLRALSSGEIKSRGRDISLSDIAILDIWLDERDGMDGVKAHCIARLSYNQDLIVEKNGETITYGGRNGIESIYGFGTLELEIDKLPSIVTSPDKMITFLKDIANSNKVVSTDKDLADIVNKAMKSKEVKVLKEFGKLSDNKELQTITRYLEQSSKMMLNISKTPVSKDKALKIIFKFLEKRERDDKYDLYNK